MKECNADEWAEFLSRFRCHGTERAAIGSDKSCMVHVSSRTGEDLGMVRYHDNVQKTYYINPMCRTEADAKAPAAPEEKPAKL